MHNLIATNFPQIVTKGPERHYSKWDTCLAHSQSRFNSWHPHQEWSLRTEPVVSPEYCYLSPIKNK